MSIKAILFDSGRVLNKPKSGHWFISPKFYEYIDENQFKKINAKKKKQAFQKAQNYIDSQPFIQNKDEEYIHFTKFYEIFWQELPELHLSKDAIQALAQDLVYNPLKYIFFEDAIRTIEALSKHYKLAVVSDAWPSLEDIFKKANVYPYFSSFIISSQIGVTKPHPKMYLSALKEINVSPNQAVLVDDNLHNCQGAMKLGIKAVLLCRNPYLYILQKINSLGKDYRVIYNLDPLEKYVLKL